MKDSIKGQEERIWQQSTKLKTETYIFIWMENWIIILRKKIKYQCDIILKSYPIKDIEFDFTNSPFIDSSGIGVILGRYRYVQAMGGTVRLSHMSPSVKKIIHMAGLHQLVEEI